MVLAFTAFVIGVIATMAQLGLTRELVALTGGNEAAYGYALGAWLAAAGAGSALAARARGRPPAWAALAAAGAALAGFVWGLWLVWGGRGFAGAALGEMVAGARAAMLSLAVVAPAAASGGAAFTLALRSAGEARRLYIAEAAGACLAGLALGLFLYRWVTPIGAGAVMAAALAAAAAVTAAKTSGRQRWIAVVCAALFLAATAGAMLGRDALTTKWFFARAFPGERIAAYKTSPYGAITVTVRESRFAVYENGLLAAAYPDLFGVEAMVIPAMLQRPVAERVVLIGGGLSGALDQFRKFPAVREITYIETDAALVAAARASFAPALARGPGVEFVAADGRGWLARAGRQGRRADVIVVSAPPPYTAQANRFYTREAFAAYKKILHEDGVVAVALPGAANYYPPDLSSLLSSCRRTALTSFRYVELLPGERGMLLASDRRPDLSLAYYSAALARSGIMNAYLTPSYFEYELTPDRLGAARRATMSPAAAVNTDLQPAGLYWGLAIWGARMGGWETVLLKTAAALRLWYILALIIAAAAGIVVLGRRFSEGAATAAAMAVQGYAGLALEILVLVGYQSVYGAVYRELAVVVGLFMAGAAAGGWRARERGAVAARQRLINLCGYAACAALVLPLLVYGLNAYAIVPMPAGRVAFGLLAAGAGFCGGGFFATAAMVRPEKAGMLYALDLAGGAAGGFATGAFLLPIWGLKGVAVALAVLLGAAMVILAVRREAAA